MNPALRVLAWLIDPRGRVTAQTYLRAGICLAAAKYASDALLVFAVTGHPWPPNGYVMPLANLGGLQLAGTSEWLYWVMAVWAVPFLFIGISLSVRRLRDAGWSWWWALLFVVPWAGYLLMAALCLLPTRAGEGRFVVEAPVEGPSGRDAALALGAALGITVVSVVLHGLVLRSYSAGLFLGTPFSLGAVTAYFYNWQRLHSLRGTLLVVFFGISFGSLALMVLALEGAVCIAMAAPLALAIALAGAVIGREMARRGSEELIRVAGVLAVVSVAPGVAPPPPAVHEVRSALVVNAPPGVVWARVIAFGELTEPVTGIFRLGVAYPVRATIEGEGVGALRRCEFSTGAFVEPITAWDPPRRLAFDVVAEPRPLVELSPYDSLRAPHLDGFLSSRRGEFRLVALPDGRTRLEGSTWYTLEMGPGGYWRSVADAIIHRIHLRVLRHVRRLAESDAGRQA